MATSIKFRLNYDGLRTLLRSDGVRADLFRRAQQVARHAGSGYVANSGVQRNRARAAALTGSAAAEVDNARNHTLVASLDAARG